MTHSDLDRTRIVRAWLHEGSTDLSPAVLDGVLREMSTTTQDRPFWSSNWPRMSTFAIGAAAAAALVVAIIGIRFLESGGPGGPGPIAPAASESPSASPLVSAPPVGSTNVPGLPAEGSEPSDATPGELVLRFEPSSPWMTSWLFADGRLITWQYARQRDADNAYIGLIEQRLTPSGVEFLTSEVISTGLVENDLDLLHRGPGFLTLDVRNGERLVSVRWGHSTWGGLEDAPFATPAQAQALSALLDLLSSPDQWPASAWADPTETTYVPSHYGICVRGVTAAVDPDRAWELLPAAARALRGDMRVTSDPGTALLTTDDARALARILEASGIERQEPVLSQEIWLRYAFADPDVAGNEIWIAFCPILPDGQAVWLGPG